jgi:hypothetical protein
MMLAAGVGAGALFVNAVCRSNKKVRGTLGSTPILKMVVHPPQR